ncbi:MAG: cupin [Frankiales bacterium]|nr:cupin [Frankiales bacterium]
MADHWHRPLAHLRGDALRSETTQTPGMQRFEAVSGSTVGSEKIWMGRVHVQAASRSGNHHHGQAETAIYVVSGTPRFVFADGTREVVIDARPGDFVFVPPWVPHREENPGSEEAVVVVSRSSQEGIVVNLPSLWPESGASQEVEVPGAVENT